MPVAVDDISRRRLILVKQLYQYAVIQCASTQSLVHRITAVIGLDLAVETALKAVVLALDQQRAPADAFQSLVQQADDLMSKGGLNPVPDKANIQFVHALRNDAQHKAKYPNETDVGDSRSFVRGFLLKLYQELWGLSFEAMSLTDTIRNDRVRQLLREAEDSLSQKDLKGALTSAAAGLQRALLYLERPLVGEDIRLGSDPYAARLSQTLKKMQHGLLPTMLGIRFSDYTRFRMTTPTISFTVDGNYLPFLRQGFDLNAVPEETARFAVAYAIDTVVQLEQLVGDFESPFGLPWYW